MNRNRTPKTPRHGGMIRQGDVLLIPVDSATATGATEPAPADARGVVLAEGETSGHHHAVVGRSVKLMRFRDGRSDRLLEIGGASGAELRVIGGGSGGVDRHTPISLSPGKFIVRVQRAWDSSARARHVQD